MSSYTTDPAAEIAALKAQEKAKTPPGWPIMPPDPATLKKAWPDAPDGKKKQRAPHTWAAPELPTPQPLVYQGYTPAQVARVLLLIAVAIAVALIID